MITTVCDYDGLPYFSEWTSGSSANCDWRPDGFGTEVRLLSLDVIHQLVDDRKDTTAYPLTNPPQILTTSSMLGRLLRFADQHLSMDFHISALSPSCSAACGLAGLFPLAI